MRKYSGQAWDGPIAGAVCSTCGSAHATSAGQTWVNELCEYKAGELVRRLARFQCGGCSEQEHRDYKAHRKAELAAMERCQVPGCRMRGTYEAGSYDHVLLCGRHLNAAKREHNRNAAALGGLALFMGAEVSGPQILKSLTDER